MAEVGAVLIFGNKSGAPVPSEVHDRFTDVRSYLSRPTNACFMHSYRIMA